MDLPGKVHGHGMAAGWVGSSQLPPPPQLPGQYLSSSHSPLVGTSSDTQGLFLPMISFSQFYLFKIVYEATPPSHGLKLHNFPETSRFPHLLPSARLTLKCPLACPSKPLSVFLQLHQPRVASVEPSACQVWSPACVLRGLMFPSVSVPL